MSASRKDEVQEAEKLLVTQATIFGAWWERWRGCFAGVVPHICLSIRVCSFFSLISEAGRRRIWRGSGAVEEIPVSTHSAAEMAPIDRCLASVAKLTLSQPSIRPVVPTIPRFLAPALIQSRQASVIRTKKTTKKKAVPKDFKRHNLEKREFPQHTLCDAMR
jgi:hypothetical protein